MRPRAQHVDQWTTLIGQSGPAGRQKEKNLIESESGAPQMRSGCLKTLPSTIEWAVNQLCRMNLREMVRQVYRPALRPFIEQMEQAPWIRGRHRLLVMEDNAPIHTAAFSNQWRKRNK
ncbi:hypothetical protein O181_049067, partial [Austropuccinia psidii MF-1]|nr:hypothetical protein [Austropuccinia psidii MF-1]